LNPEFRQLCSDKNKDDDEPWLFENLKDKLKDMSEREKLALSLKPGFRMPQYGRGQQNIYRRGRFQGGFRLQNNYGGQRGNRGGSFRGAYRKRSYPLQKPFLGQSQKRPQKKN
jgi:hypothetical protein